MIIYKIENKYNGKIYIGQTIKPLSDRIARHIRTNKYPIQKAINKYGINGFIVSIIDSAESKSVLDEKERYWISFFNSKVPVGYNCTDGGEGCIGRTPSEESRKRMSDSHRGKVLPEEQKKKISIALKGKKFSNEYREKLSLAAMGRVVSDETREKISASRKGIKTGRPSPNRGKHLSEETKDKMSAVRKGVPKPPGALAKSWATRKANKLAKQIYLLQEAA